MTKKPSVLQPSNKEGSEDGGTPRPAEVEEDGFNIQSGNDDTDKGAVDFDFCLFRKLTGKYKFYRRIKNRKMRKMQVVLIYQLILMLLLLMGRNNKMKRTRKIMTVQR